MSEAHQGDPGSKGGSHCIVLLPAYNEAANLPRVVQEAYRVLGSNLRVVVVVDDGSTDKTSEVITTLQKSYSVHVERHIQNMGLARALDTGFRVARGMIDSDDVVITMDADGTQPAETMTEMTQRVRADADVVIASRYVPGGRQSGVPLIRILLSAAINRMLRARFRIPAKDCTSGYRAYSGKLIRQMVPEGVDRFLSSTGFEASFELLCRASRLTASISEVPLMLDYSAREGKSKMRVGNTIYNYLNLLFAPKSF